MSAPVDVLAVMDSAISLLTSPDGGEHYTPGMIAARAAVAEMIEAAQAEHARAARPVFGDGAASYDRLSSALARVQGVAK